MTESDETGGKDDNGGDSDDDHDSNWNSSLYDSKFIRDVDDLIDLLGPFGDERILDLGCGTGHPTRRIADSGAEVVGLDSSEEMVRKARAEYPDLTFVCADARDFSFERPFDAVFSNAALHWVERGDQPRLLDSVYANLRPGAEFGGEGNVEKIVEAVHDELDARGYEIAHPWYFPRLADYVALLDEHGFDVTYARTFDRPSRVEGRAGMKEWLGMFGDGFFESVPEDERDDVVRAVSDALKPGMYDAENDAWIIDYTRLRFVARKDV
ncbi:MAG: methyltransferase domain-containing protein [Halobacteria archaeon]|nr:methyltransferase domain-containing protein [Halobacteria archaeon]